MPLPVEYHKMRQKRGTTAEWAADDDVLESGEIGLEIDGADDFLGMKIGNETDPWSALPYVMNQRLSSTDSPTFDDVTVTGTVDGRDVSVDGAKLDGIEDGAEANNISDGDATDLTDGGSTTLHTHPAAAPAAHATSHTDGSDDIQDATAAQKGLMTAAYASKLDGIEDGAEANNISDAEFANKQVVNNGFATDVTVTWDDASRTATITTADYRFNVDGTQYHKTAGESKQIADTDGEHYVYYDNTGTLVESMTVWDLEITAPVAIVYWNATLAKGVAFREMHTATMDQYTHRLNHLTRGAQYVAGGGSIADYTLATSTDAGITFSLTEMTMLDEDLASTLDALADAGPYFKLYRTGASGVWTWTENSAIPVWTAGGGNIAWNELTGGAWQLTEITANNNRVNYYVVGVPRIGSDADGGLSFALLPGQATYASLAAAQVETLANVQGLGDVSPEIVPMYRITLKYTSAGGGTSKAEIEAIQDLRGESFKVVTAAVVGDHQTLTNRSATAAHPASSINTDVTDFDGLLSATDVDVQTALETIDGVLGQYENMWIPAGAFAPRTTNGAEAATEEYATNDVMLNEYLFDGATEEAISAQIAFPDSWDLGTIKAKVYWDAATGATAADGVVWGISGRSIRNDDAIDAALGTEILATDAVIAVGDLHISPATAAITLGGTAALGNMALLQIARKVGEAADDMTEDAKFLGVMIQYKKLTTSPVIW